VTLGVSGYCERPTDNKKERMRGTGWGGATDEQTPSRDVAGLCGRPLGNCLHKGISILSSINWMCVPRELDMNDDLVRDC